MMSKKCKIIVCSIIIVVIGFILYAIYGLMLYFGVFAPRFVLKGDSHIVIEAKQEYIDEGVKAVYRGKDLSDEVTINNHVDIHKVGTYEVEYSWDKYQKRITRIVEVKDTKAPNIELKGEAKVRVFENGSYEEKGYQASDDVDGNLTSVVEVKNNIDFTKKGVYEISYTVADKSGNKQQVTREVEVCADPTNIRLQYAHDAYDNTMEEWWFVKSVDHQRTTAAMDESLLKTYDAYFQGNDEKVIYLTFDEGGSDITYIKEIAEVLNKHDVKATFFLTRNYIRMEKEFMKELVAAGHLIANHTWHHYDMTTLANEQRIDDFVLEITETEKTYMEVVGEPMKKIFRFPKGGGSERALKIMQDLGYRTYYWSHAYYDFGGDVAKEDTLKTLMDHYHNGAIYLLHPSNKGNYEAMDDFITQMKDLGYRFDTVDAIGN